MNTELACFISAHGYGHATRTIGLLQAIQQKIPDLKTTIFTSVPEALFSNSGITFTYHHTITDVGLIQHDAFTEDLDLTLEKLGQLIPFKKSLIQLCADRCRSCQLILCDISCLGIEVARQMGIPSVLVENFTWDWIYSRLPGAPEGLLAYVDLFAAYYEKADYRIQTEPVCNRRDCDLSCLPIARKWIMSREKTRELIDSGNRITVLISMGGMGLDLPFIDRLAHYDEYLFVIAGHPRNYRYGENVRFLSSTDTLHHPDLIRASDLLICKSGYSTVAECLQSDTPICCITRERFAESTIIENFIVETMHGTILDEQSFFSADWLSALPDLLDRKRAPIPINGGEQAAAFICSLL